MSSFASAAATSTTAAAARAAHSRMPVLAVVGTTGVGKSKLAIQLAQAFGGHVVNADSMQVYRGLDLATNKPTHAEMSAVPHHLFGFVDPAKEYSVSEFTHDAEKTIEDIHAQGKIPVIVGGTHYYIQALLWRQNIIQTAPTFRIPSTDDQKFVDLAHASLSAHPQLRDELLTALEATDPRLHSATEIATFTATDALHTLLAQVDPIMANRWHPRDSRKIRRSLEVFYTTGQKHSEWMEKQAQEKQHAESLLKYPTLVFWLYGKPAALYPRLDARVDEMIGEGLFAEMQEMRDKMFAGQVIGLSNGKETTFNLREALASGSVSKSDLYNRGILQAIGFKEFHDYFEALEQQKESSDASQIDRLRTVAIDDMKRATRQYARRQITWLRNKLAPSLLKDHQHTLDAAFYLLDATRLDDWDTRIRAEAERLARLFLETREKIDPWSTSSTASEMFPSRNTIDAVQGTQDESNDTNHEDDGCTDHGIALSPSQSSTSAAQWKKYRCDVCVDSKTGQHRMFNGSHEWQIHVKTRKHRMNVTSSNTTYGGSYTHRQPKDYKDHADTSTDTTKKQKVFQEIVDVLQQRAQDLEQNEAT